MLKDAVYMDHAGTTLYSKSLVERFTADMINNLYGNPHSASPSSQRSTRRIENVRLQLLAFFNAGLDDFDVVFTANATAGIKTVMEALREHENGFIFGYHRDSHTSLVGMRESAREHVCLESDAEVDSWINPHRDLPAPEQSLRLLAYPAQSNLNGRRLPLRWCSEARKKQTNGGLPIYTLLDAAALVSSTPLGLSDANSAPDFTVLSLYKIFGFPDLGALIVRKASAHVLQHRRYFGGGTVNMVACLKEQWHAKKLDDIHEQLEDGTLPVHSVIALKAAMDVHNELFESLERVSRHTMYLADKLYQNLRALRHGNGRAVCKIYKDESSTYGDSATQGPVVAFNFRTSQGGWVSNAEVEKLAAIKNVHVRTGGLCCPGGIASFLDLKPWELRKNFSAGQRCGDENDIHGGKPTGMIRASLGAMSTISDVTRFSNFVREFFVDDTVPISRALSPVPVDEATTSCFHVESLTVYPVKSCAGWQVPHDTPWEVRKEGLAWDREWCLVHQGTGVALSQKRHPRMALIRPSLDFEAGLLRVRAVNAANGAVSEVTVPLSADPSCFTSEQRNRDWNTQVCGDRVMAQTYISSHIAAFFTDVIGVPCQLARFPAVTSTSLFARHSKAHLAPSNDAARVPRPILLSNESPILTISRSSLNRLNETIKSCAGKAAHPSVFRANIVLAESPSLPPGQEQPYAEDHWRSMRIGGEFFEILGGCRRCQMVCVDQDTAEKNEEPFVTLAKTRRVDGRVLFGVHTAHVPVENGSSLCPMIQAGDTVETFGEDVGLAGLLSR
ncbi:hypothetical protein LTR28_013132 [Elasticomyces elasticus]|nr:hypothetical protein LTR28_013132 [Elasticomyces elasticus]